MTKQQQTEEVKVQLFHLTLQFTRKYQPRYYYQYRGELYDLAMEFYCDFLTPKGRSSVKETLLDKFDPSITTLPYLVKVSTIRKLIDRSRADSTPILSIDALIESYGDLITKTFNLSTSPLDSEFGLEPEESYSLFQQKTPFYSL